RGHHGYLIGARYFQTELHVKSDGRSERNRIEGALPVIGYSGGVTPFDGLELRAQITLFSLSLGNGNEEGGLIEVVAIEIQVGLVFSLLPWLDIEAGYLFGDLLLRRERDDDEEMVEVSTHRLGVRGSIRF
ncbi:MAG: hypothetical protein O6952_10890, partial [Planctomycetota bacterium]|nr:hypothetical protein [Planctomycetota bacterium]